MDTRQLMKVLSKLPLVPETPMPTQALAVVMFSK
jgi:hypothetical protein